MDFSIPRLGRFKQDEHARLVPANHSRWANRLVIRWPYLIRPFRASSPNPSARQQLSRDSTAEDHDMTSSLLSIDSGALRADFGSACLIDGQDCAASPNLISKAATTMTKPFTENTVSQSMPASHQPAMHTFLPPATPPHTPPTDEEEPVYNK
jgi:hypothetical protein